MATSGKKRPLSRQDAIPLRDMAERRIIIITYEPDSDVITVDDQGCSKMEARGMIEMAWNKVYESVE